MHWISAHWPWYISGPAIGLVVPLLYLLVGKPFGVSRSFSNFCSLPVLAKLRPQTQQTKPSKDLWNFFFVGGIPLGSYIGAHLLSIDLPQLLPDHYHSTNGMIALFAGGILVGFGTRYADGCTSGHSLTGLSNLQAVSLIATLSFFVGGLTWVGLSSLF
jgi:uncharacterized protein